MIVTVEVSPREAREAQNVAICQSNVCSGGNVCSCWFAWAVMEPNRWITVVSCRRWMEDDPYSSLCTYPGRSWWKAGNVRHWTWCVWCS